MNKNKIAIFFSFIFILFITAPTAVTLIDESIDISFIYSTSEEEEQGQKGDKNVKVFIVQVKPNKFEFAKVSNDNNLGHNNTSYSKPYLNIVFPPPEHAVAYS